MTRILTVNTGNSNTTLALFEGRSLKKVWKTSSHPASFKSLLGKFPSVDRVVVSSVVPSLKTNLFKMAKSLGRKPPLFVNGRMKMPVRLKLKNPSRVGPDRIANAVAARHLYPRQTVLIVDLGTAVTLDVLNSKGEFLGGLIAPGRTLLAQVLHQKCALLPLVTIKKPKNLLGRDTTEAIQSAVFWGYVELIDGLIRRLRAKLGNFRVIATGGLAPSMRPFSQYIKIIRPHLTLEGLHILAEHIDLRRMRPMHSHNDSSR